MSTRTFLLKTTFLLLAGLLCFPCTAQQTLSAMNPALPRVKPNTLVFKLKPAAGLQQLSELVAPLQPRSLRQKFPQAQPRRRAGETDLRRIYELEYAPGLSGEQVKQRLLASGLMEYVEPLYPLYYLL